jgi:pyruvate/2-oxoglutarate dehydrogenase complex dihydrolipoamide acyltransferase (E2) component
MPKLGMTMKSGFVVKWYKKEGEKVAKEEPLFDVESGKIINEVKSPVNGFIKKIFAIENKEYKVGEVIALIAETEVELTE